MRLPKKAPKKTRKKILNDVKDWFKERSLDDFLMLGVGAWAAKHTNNPINALHGMIGYKLAQSMNLPAGMAGVAILAAVGIGGLPLAGEDKVMLAPPDKPDIECPAGHVLKWSILGGWQCVKVRP
jgi:hypothetical protein